MEKQTKTIKNNEGKNVKVIISTTKDSEGNVLESTAKFSQAGIKKTNGITGKISEMMLSQIAEVTGTNDIVVSMAVKAGNKSYVVKVDVNDFHVGAKMKVFAEDTRTGKYFLVNADTYMVNKKGNVNITLPSGSIYRLVIEKEADSLEKKILKTVSLAKSSVSMKKGETEIIKISDELDRRNVSKITYVTNKSSVVTVSKSGKITAKKIGTAVIKVKIMLKNGTLKTLKYWVKVTEN